jgi:CheY-like chemotaxis protein
VSETPLLSQLLHMLGPDIRSSLGELQGTLHLIAHDLVDEAEQDVGSQRRLELVANAQERVGQFASMLSIVTHLDTLSRGDLKMRPEQIDLHRVLDRIAHQLNAHRTQEPVRLAVQIEPASKDALASVCVDAANLSQLLGYVLRFAWSTTQENLVSVTIHCDGERLEITVANHGVVMSAEELDQLFSLTPWANRLSHRIQADDPTLRLGLNLAMAIARAMDGNCEVASDSRMGCVWSIAVPALPVPAILTESLVDQGIDADTSLALQQTPRSSGAGYAKTLLVVDDSQSSRMVTRALLEDLGHSVAEAANGIEALVRLRTDPMGPFDAVIMDLMMPEMDGLSAARAIRDLPSSSQTSRLIALTGHNSSDEISAAEKAGFDDFLSKPVDRSALEQCLERTLGEGCHTQSEEIVNLQVLSELEAMLSSAAMDRLLKQFLAELDDRMRAVMSFADGDIGEVYHNIHMIRYSAEHFGFERLAECAKRVGQIRMSLDDVSFFQATSESPQFVYEPSAEALAALEQLSAQIQQTHQFLRERFAARDG